MQEKWPHKHFTPLYAKLCTELGVDTPAECTQRLNELAANNYGTRFVLSVDF